jgi:hypothetical protein
MAAVIFGSIFLTPSIAAAKRGYCGNCKSSRLCSYCLEHFGVCYPNQKACKAHRRGLLDNQTKRVIVGANQTAIPE